MQVVTWPGLRHHQIKCPPSALRTVAQMKIQMANTWQHPISGHSAQGTGLHIVGQHAGWDLVVVVQHNWEHVEAVDTALLDHDGVACIERGVSEVELRKVGQEGGHIPIGSCVDGSPQLCALIGPGELFHRSEDLPIRPNMVTQAKCQTHASTRSAKT